MRVVPICFALGLSACATAPTMQSGVGFDTYDPYRAAREAELRATAGPVLVEPGAASGQQVITGNELAQAGIGTAAAGPADAASTFGGGGNFSPAAPAQAEAPPPGGNVGISDEQDFGAVASRESIQSDAERLAAQRQAYEVIEPEPLPERPSDTGPNIVQYALSTTNQPGEQIYTRSGFNAQARFTRNCAKYPSSDQAQQAFLEGGGPQRDRMGLDPDGDGFACYWDPRPFRTARGG